jgi:hypothetical protein
MRLPKEIWDNYNLMLNFSSNGLSIESARMVRQDM